MANPLFYRFFSGWRARIICVFGLSLDLSAAVANNIRLRNFSNITFSECTLALSGVNSQHQLVTGHVTVQNFPSFDSRLLSANFIPNQMSFVQLNIDCTVQDTFFVRLYHSNNLMLNDPFFSIAPAPAYNFGGGQIPPNALYGSDIDIDSVDGCGNLKLTYAIFLPLPGINSGLKLNSPNPVWLYLNDPVGP